MSEREKRFAAAVEEALVPWLRNVFSAVEDPGQRKVAMEVIDCIPSLMSNSDHIAPVMMVADAEQDTLLAQITPFASALKQMSKNLRRVGQEEK